MHTFTQAAHPLYNYAILYCIFQSTSLRPLILQARFRPHPSLLSWPLLHLPRRR